MNKYCLFTNDVETTSIWYNSLRDETGLKVLKEGMPLLLSLYEKYEIKTTFFFTGYIAKLYPEIVKMIIPYGHEVGSHGLSHKKEDGFDLLPLKAQIYHLRESKKILEDISGQGVISFRSPALRVSRNTSRALIEAGYKIDSSVASQRFDMFFSFGSLKKLNWLIAPRLPYVSDMNNIFKKGEDGVIEIPLSAVFFPYVGTTMRIFTNITKFIRALLLVETCYNGKPIVFDIHPNEFIEENTTSEKRKIKKRSKNYIKYFMSDYLRSRLKVKNIGCEAIPLYLNEIEYFKKKKYTFFTVRDYVKHLGFLK